MKYFYCQSYQAFNMALTMNMKEEVVVVTGVDNIVKACNFLHVKYVKHKKIGTGEIIKKKAEVENELNRLVGIIKNDELHFSHTQFAVFCFLLVSRLNNIGGKTVFHNFEFLYSQTSIKSLLRRSYITSKLKQLYIKKQYNIPLEVRMSAKNSLMLSIPLNYIYQNCSAVIENKEDYYGITLEMFQNYKFEYPAIDNLFISQTFTNRSFFRRDKIEELLPILNVNSISVKNHPKLGSVDGLENCTVLPDYLPVELFFQKVKGSIISFHSASLITASIFKDVNVISLLNIVKTDDPFWVEVKKDMNEKSKGEIVFVSDVNELKSMLT